MRIVELESWDHFEPEMDRIRARDLARGRQADFLFRGVGDSRWTLTTTLERRGLGGLPVNEYYRLMSVVRPGVESVTGKKWEYSPMVDVGPAALWKPNPASANKYLELGEYSYMIYLRHHGFPSPLLDWSRSPFVAAFFAFRSSEAPAGGKVSVYVYGESTKAVELMLKTRPDIYRPGPYVTTHRRHFLQRCEYTMCAVIGDGQQWKFVSHDEVFADTTRDQDLYWRIDLPWSDRMKVLRKLDSYNLNALSLFETDEALMETMALRELDFKAPGT